MTQLRSSHPFIHDDRRSCSCRANHRDMNNNNSERPRKNVYARSMALVMSTGIVPWYIMANVTPNISVHTTMKSCMRLAWRHVSS